jgi:hypothetical protein
MLPPGVSIILNASIVATKGFLLIDEESFTSVDLQISFFRPVQTKA